MTEHERRMRRALELAERGRGRTWSNPLVGAVLVKQGKVVGEGWHRRWGGPHAEVHALRAAGRRAKGADLYVTLEPCVHEGKTPPCAPAVIAAGVKRAWVAVTDPDPRMRGKGVAALRGAGLTVRVGLLAEEARRQNFGYRKRLASGLPAVTLKLALSADGRIAVPGGKRAWITDEACREDAHRLRDRADAVLVGRGTVVADDPRLTVRLRGRERGIPRVVLDTRASTPPRAKLVRTAREVPTWIVAGKRALAAPSAARRARALERAGCRVLPVAGGGTRVSPRAALRAIAREGVADVLVEGGAEVATSFLAAGLVDRVVLYVAPLLLGGRAPAAFGALGVLDAASVVRLAEATWTPLGDGVRVEGAPARGNRRSPSGGRSRRGGR